MDISVGPVVGGSSSSWSQWLEVDDATLMQLLTEHGQDVTTLESNQTVTIHKSLRIMLRWFHCLGAGCV